MIRCVVIAVTMTCLVISTLTIMLWIRSYFWLDYRIWENSTSYVFVHSQQGQVRCVVARVGQGATLSEPLMDALFRETFALPNSPHLVPIEWPAQHRVLRQFQWTSFTDGIRVVVPHWVFALFFGVTAIALWVRRFRIRTLLLATMVLAVILSFTVRSN